MKTNFLYMLFFLRCFFNFWNGSNLANGNSHHDLHRMDAIVCMYLHVDQLINECGLCVTMHFFFSLSLCLLLWCCEYGNLTTVARPILREKWNFKLTLVNLYDVENGWVRWVQWLLLLLLLLFICDIIFVVQNPIYRITSMKRPSLHTIIDCKLSK